MKRIWLALAVGALLLMASTASAASKPAVYFWRDASVQGQKVPVGDGILSTIPPAPADLENVTNNEAPGTRMIFPFVDAAIPQQFVTINTTNNQARIYGPILVFAFVPKTPAIANANLSFELVYLPPGAAPTAAGEVIGRASVAVDGGNQTLPDPTTFVPPNPGNPEEALAYIQTQLLIYGLTKLSEGRVIAFLDDDVKDYVVDKTVDANGTLALRLALEPGSSPLGQPLGAGQPIVYDFALTPSLVYVPWYAPDPVKTPTKTPTGTATPSPTSTSPSKTITSSSSSDGKKSPDAGLVAFAAIGMLAYALRRRL